MKEKIMSWLPFIFAYYTIIVVVTCSYNLLIGNSYIDLSWFLEAFGFLVVYTLLHQLLDFINFKHDFTLILAETGLAYVLFLAAGYLFHWFVFTPERLLLMTLFFLSIVVIGVSYMKYRHKLRVKELNELIQKKND